MLSPDNGITGDHTTSISDDSHIDEEQPQPQPSCRQSSATSVLPDEGSSCSVDGACHDIGNILAPSKSTDEICTSINGLTNGEKFSLLYHHVQPPNALRN